MSPTLDINFDRLAVIYANRGAQKLYRMNFPVRCLYPHLVGLDFGVSTIVLNHVSLAVRPCRCNVKHLTFFNQLLKSGLGFRIIQTMQRAFASAFS